MEVLSVGLLGDDSLEHPKPASKSQHANRSVPKPDFHVMGVNRNCAETACAINGLGRTSVAGKRNSLMNAFLLVEADDRRHHFKDRVTIVFEPPREIGKHLRRGATFARGHVFQVSRRRPPMRFGFARHEDSESL